MITTEDCTRRCHNRFKVILLTAERAKQISLGDNAKVRKTKKNEKEAIVALRELASGKLEIMSTDGIR